MQHQCPWVSIGSRGQHTEAVNVAMHASSYADVASSTYGRAGCGLQCQSRPETLPASTTTQSGPSVPSVNG